MNRYISILRGINVSGQRRIKMPDLERMFESLGFNGVESYIQSGNVIFSAEKEKPEILAGQISGEIEKQFGFAVPVIVMETDKLLMIIQNNPYLSDPKKSTAYMHVTFLAEIPKPHAGELAPLPILAGEEAVIMDEAIYLYCPHGYGRTKLNNTYFEKRLKVMATTRNWNTVVTLLLLAQK